MCVDVIVKLLHPSSYFPSVCVLIHEDMRLCFFHVGCYCARHILYDLTT